MINVNKQKVKFSKTTTGHKIHIPGALLYNMNYGRGTVVDIRLFLFGYA